ncbi:MFS transporter [Arthrobacter russicus]|uniref:EmrB/QacA subfamily drug resistance transporter n=1 Tax=Arthrobacter russicus TaxID=172040 RepID=A0ABU1JC38_9MICC|nr:MFS transporter [Arthrobacter russicus]MDR6269975.1 EmrB/QacA subfamily drug resistance transporter [Arthrobacter russicus]
MPAHLEKLKTSTRRPTWLIVTILCLAGTVVALQQTLMVPLLPDFPKILHTSPDDVSWLVTATLLTAAVATPIVSKLADMYGKRRMMIVAMVMMVIGSVICAVGESFTMLVIGRAFQGFAASLIPVGISIMRDELPKERVASAVALMSATLGIGSALGLPLSGLIYESLGWEAIFWLSTVVGVLLIVAVLSTVPESELRTKGRFDFLGAVLLSIALTALLLAISKGGNWGWSSEPVILLFITAAVFLAAWVPYELRVSQPMVDLRTSSRRPVLLTNLASLLVGFSMYANMLATTQQLQLPQISGFGFGLAVTVAGLCMVPSGLAMVAFAPISASLTKKFGAKTTLIVGAAVLAGAYIARVFLTGEVWMIILGATAVSVGTAIAYAAMPTLIMRAVPITETASANGLNSLLRAVGTSTASAAIAAILTSFVSRQGSITLPTLSAFTTIFWLAAVAALAAIAVAVFIPGAKEIATATGAIRVVPGVPNPAAAKTASQALVSDDDEIVVRGVVVGPAGKPVRNAVVTVLDLDGEPADWSRADNEGRYTLALPGEGRYLVVSSAEGWAPSSEVAEFAAGEKSRVISLSERFGLSGTVRSGGRRVENALVTLTKPTGEFVGSARTDVAGNYEMPLPQTGRYIVSVLAAGALQAIARQILLPGQSSVVDFEDLPLPELVSR